ncbi:MAG: hypothetical protein LBS89_03950, partial [Zoogloeaceae bacterium]|jgi:hypothetical protein|nr:hypothetical protein [Zoogloeaceae bacterium]
MRHFALPHQNLKTPSRRRFLALCLPLAVIPLLPATPLIAVLTRIRKAISGVWPLESKMGEVDYSKPFYLREAPGAVLWLTEHIQTYVAAKDHARVLAAAMKIDALYPFFWVMPNCIPDFATVFAYLETGAIPAHRQGLERWHCGIYPDRDETEPPLRPSLYA